MNSSLFFVDTDAATVGWRTLEHMRPFNEEMIAMACGYTVYCVMVSSVADFSIDCFTEELAFSQMRCGVGVGRTSEPVTLGVSSQEENSELFTLEPGLYFLLCVLDLCILGVGASCILCTYYRDGKHYRSMSPSYTSMKPGY